MVTVEKPESITVTVRNRKKNRSKSITLYDTTVEEVYKEIKKIFEEKD